MMGNSVILTPRAAVDHICHEEQITIWSSDLIGRLSVEGFLRDDIDYDGVIRLHQAVSDELRRTLEIAFDHPEARTLAIRGDRQER